MTTWPPATIPVFPDGYGPYPTDFNSWIQSNLSSLTSSVVFRGRQTAVQALAAGAVTALNLQAIDEDPYGGWSAAGAGSQAAMSWLAPVTGLYQVTVVCMMASSSNWTLACSIVTGTFFFLREGGSSNVGGTGIGGSGSFSLVAGLDYVQAGVDALVAVNTVVGAGFQSSMEIALLSQ